MVSFDYSDTKYSLVAVVLGYINIGQSLLYSAFISCYSPTSAIRSLYPGMTCNIVNNAIAIGGGSLLSSTIPPS